MCFGLTRTLDGHVQSARKGCHLTRTGTVSAGSGATDAFKNVSVGTTSDDVSQKTPGDVSKSVKMSLLETPLKLFQKRFVTFLKFVRFGDVSKNVW